MNYYVEPWPRLPRKTKKLVDGNSRRKEHRRDRKRWAHYLDRRVKKVDLKRKAS